MTFRKRFTGSRDGSQGLFEVRSGFVRDPFGDVQGPFGIRKFLAGSLPQPKRDAARGRLKGEGGSPTLPTADPFRTGGSGGLGYPVRNEKF